MVDCAFENERAFGWPYGGCNGGYQSDALDYIIQNNGLPLESTWPYTATEVIFINFISKFRNI